MMRATSTQLPIYYILSQIFKVDQFIFIILLSIRGNIMTVLCVGVVHNFLFTRLMHNIYLRKCSLIDCLKTEPLRHCEIMSPGLVQINPPSR